MAKLTLKKFLKSRQYLFLTIERVTRMCFPVKQIFIRGYLYQCVNARNIVYDFHWVRLDEQIDSIVGFPIAPFSLGFGVLFISAFLLTGWAHDSITIKQVKIWLD